MAAPSSPNATHSRFSRVGLGLGLKSHPELRIRAQESEKALRDDDWYIPYTGPYELPPETRSPRRRDRDSWGDPIYVPGGTKEHVHYEDDVLEHYHHRSAEETRTRGRNRAYSLHSIVTESSGNVDASSSTYAATRRSNVSSPRHTTAFSYVSPDSAGGVGETPIPPHVNKDSRDRGRSRRASFISIFSAFGAKSPRSPSIDRTATSPTRRRFTALNNETEMSNRRSGTHARSRSGESYRQSMRGKQTIRDALQSVDSRTTDEDYYNSYYSTLIHSPSQGRIISGQLRASSSAPPTSGLEPPPTYHPYAVASPQADDSQPSPPKKKATFADTQKETPHPPSTSTPHPIVILPNSIAKSSTPLSHPHLNNEHERTIKGSSSTPNLQLRVSMKPSPQPKPIPKTKDRWLSAETWCDALLFPRPRLKVKPEHGSGRIISPPGSPVFQNGFDEKVHKGSVASRVLAHSRSLVNLAETTQGIEQHSKVGISLSAPSEKRGDDHSPNKTRLSRPKSWALDDLDLPIFVPSLDKVLQDGETLETERKQWRTKALGSLGNKHSRSLSRARSKSLTAKGRKAREQPQSNFDFLTARACLGNQDIPITPPMNRHPTSPRRDTTSRSSHARTHSSGQTYSEGLQSHTTTRSSKSHSHSDSWSKLVPKLARNRLGNDAPPALDDPKARQRHMLEAALQRDDTKVIRLADPAAPFVSKNLNTPDHSWNGHSPAPSAMSDVPTDSQVGIALSTPPLDHMYDRGNIRMPSHPYAQGGVYSYTDPKPITERSTTYAGPHPSLIVKPPEDLEAPAARHKLPPHVTFHHPYAQASSAGGPSDLLTADLRSSPFTENDIQEDDGDRVHAITNIVGVGEALANAGDYNRESRDSGLGTSESQHDLTIVREDADNDVATAYNTSGPFRLPIQYDVTRPIYRSQQTQKSSETAHTVASSPLEHSQTLKVLGNIQTESVASRSPMVSSDSSSQRDTPPRPLGSPNDLTGFHDLFYKPDLTMPEERHDKLSYRENSFNGSQTRPSSIPFDLKAPLRRPTSGLAHLARQLSEEYEQLSIMARTDSQFSQSSGSHRRPNLARRPTETSSLEFVFQEMPLSDSPVALQPHEKNEIFPFQPSKNIPEDVESSYSIEKHEDDIEETENFRLGQVEALTPSAYSPARRLSSSGQMEYEHGQFQEEFPIKVTEDNTKSPSPLSTPATEARVLSGLQPPLTDITRSSYMTTSTMSRMSNLSDFPVPPRDYLDTHRLSLLSAYFDETLGKATSNEHSPPPQSTLDEDVTITSSNLPSKVEMVNEESIGPSASLQSN